MGWLGWTEQETLDTSIPAIVLAYEGRSEMIRRTLESVFGSGDDPEPDAPTPTTKAKPLSAATVQSVFRALAG